MLTTEKFIRKPFFVDALRVTEENIEQIAKWCGGTIESEKRGKKDVSYILVPVSNPLSDRQKKAFVGDWVLYSNGNWKSYTHRAFEASFEPYRQNVEPVQEEKLFELQNKFPLGGVARVDNQVH